MLPEGSDDQQSRMGNRMTEHKLGSFPVGVSERLKTYVYRLIDPRNGETFYVGKGRGDRVFSHVRAEIDGDDLGNNKLQRIRTIRLAGFEVAHVIHRHGMDDKTAFEVEAALIDAYPGLTNVVGGTGSGDDGATAYGWFAAHLEGGARTIMAYYPQNGCTAPCTRILNYSNPAVFGPADLGLDWFRTGTAATADNALIIADYASYTAQYRPSLGRIFYDGFDN
jgi:hypothetical protein